VVYSFCLLVTGRSGVLAGWFQDVNGTAEGIEEEQ
jgi:hypothetical protein